MPLTSPRAGSADRLCRKVRGLLEMTFEDEFCYVAETQTTNTNDKLNFSSPEKLAGEWYGNYK